MQAEIFDTHCHLTFKQLLPQRERIIAEAVEAGITHMLTVTCALHEIPEALATAQMHDRLWVAAGIHPHEAKSVTDQSLKQLADYWNDPRIVAAGEMGLDFHYDFSPRETQKTALKKQLELALEADLPVIIHCREAHEDVVRILTEQGHIHRPVVFHCFSGTPEQAEEIRANGWWLSFTGTITFKNAEPQRQACLETPEDMLMFETDAPFLTPEPIRKIRPNEPKYLVHTLNFTAQLRNQSPESLAQATTQNALRFFRLKQ